MKQEDNISNEQLDCQEEQEEITNYVPHPIYSIFLAFKRLCVKLIVVLVAFAIFRFKDFINVIKIIIEALKVKENAEYVIELGILAIKYGIIIIVILFIMSIVLKFLSTHSKNKDSKKPDK